MKKKVNYTLPVKMVFYAQHIDDTDMCNRARKEFSDNSANGAVSRIKTLVAYRKIKKELMNASKKGTESALYEKWGKEIKEHERKAKSADGTESGKEEE